MDENFETDTRDWTETSSLYADLDAGWSEVLEPIFAGDAFKERMRALKTRLNACRAEGRAVFPPRVDVFQAFQLTPFADIRVVILGQDPYHGPGQAHGLAFSLRPENKTLQPSLRNIFQEVSTDIVGAGPPVDGSLVRWARQGVFLLNTALTVEQGRPMAHMEFWTGFTDAVIAAVARQAKHPVVFMLWGAEAKRKAALITKAPGGSRHAILTAAHPSPFSAARGFFGSRHFSQANAFLEKAGLGKIDW